MILEGNKLKQPSELPIKKRPMTLIVGIVCKDEIVIASDSRMTFPAYSKDNLEKIRILEHKRGKVLVAWSGYRTFAGDTVDLLEKRMSEFEPKHYRDIAELAKTLVDEVRIREMAPYKEGRMWMDQVQNYLRDNENFLLMLAYYHEGIPYIYTVGFPSGAIHREESFAAIGQSESIGTYLLEQYIQPGIESELATALAVYIVESIGKHDKTVGGPTKVGVIRELRIRPPSATGIDLPDYSPTAYLLPQKDVETISQLSGKVHKSITQRQNKELRDCLSKETSKKIKKIMKGMQGDLDSLCDEK